MEQASPLISQSSVEPEGMLGDSRMLPPEKTSTTPLVSEAEGLSLDSGEAIRSLDQATLFRAVDDGNVACVEKLLRNRVVDVNAYNDEGITAIFVAVYRYEHHRNPRITEVLLAAGARVDIKAATPPSAHKISIVRHDLRPPHGEVLLETKRINLDHKTPLLLALELKSSLYLRGWEYRHWDQLIHMLAAATVKESTMDAGPAAVPLVQVPDCVARGWMAVWESHAHELVEVWAEGHYCTCLKALLLANSTMLGYNIEKPTALTAARVEIREASFSVAKAMVGFMYTGEVDPELMTTRGIDIYKASHTYGVEALRVLSESLISPTQATWIKVLTAAVETGSSTLTLKVAQGIQVEMEQRQDFRSSPKPVMNELMHPDGGPGQLFNSAGAE